jgi:hypothetical protein
MNVDDLVFVTPHKVRRENFHEAREHDKINLVFFEQSQRLALGWRAVVPRNVRERQFVFSRERRVVGAVGNHEQGIGFELAAVVRGQERVEAMRFLRHHDGEALAAVGFGEAHLDFHAEPAGEGVQSGAQARDVAIRRTPRGLEGHAELAAGDLFLQRLDIGVLLEQKSGDARNDAGFVPANNGDGGELSHIGAGNGEFSPQLHEL